MITLKEAKNYLRVDYEEDDKLIQNLLSTAKQLVMDVGRMSEEDFSVNEDTVRTAMLFALGFLYENAVAQAIQSTGRNLFYMTWPKENSTHNYEIDFLIRRGTHVQPIECKSSRIDPHLSLDEFCRKYSAIVIDPLIASQKDIRKIGPITNIPFYMVPNIFE